MKAPKKTIAIVGVALGALAIGAIAFAAWTSNGTGAEAAKSTTDKASAITAETSVADLYPGAQKSVTVRISNPNDYPVMVTGIAAGSSKAVNGCAADSVRSDARTDIKGLTQADGSTIKVVANGSGVYQLTTRMTNDPTDACKSQTFDFPLTATLDSAASAQGF